MRTSFYYCSIDIYHKVYLYAIMLESVHTVGIDIPTLSPLDLDTLQLTGYILKLIKNGITTEQLCACLEGEYSLAGAYLRLLSELDWISKQGDKWLLTSLGEENISRFQSPR